MTTVDLSDSDVAFKKIGFCRRTVMDLATARMQQHPNQQITS
jgi:hypothetical protein